MQDNLASYYTVIPRLYPPFRSAQKWGYKRGNAKKKDLFIIQIYTYNVIIKNIYPVCFVLIYQCVLFQPFSLSCSEKKYHLQLHDLTVQYKYTA